MEKSCQKHRPHITSAFTQADRGNISITRSFKNRLKGTSVIAAKLKRHITLPFQTVTRNSTYATEACFVSYYMEEEAGFYLFELNIMGSLENEKVTICPKQEGSLYFYYTLRWSVSWYSVDESVTFQLP